MKTLSSRRFFAGFAVAACCVILTGAALIYRGIYFLPINQSSALVKYQKDKLRAAPPAEIILVGDSSLGNGIDAAELSRLSGKTCLNLALNGNFGLEGSLEMIKAALEDQPVRKVIIMQTLDTLTRERREESLVYAATSPASLFSWNIERTRNNLAKTVEIFLSGKLLAESARAIQGTLSPPLTFVDDYVRPSKPIPLEKARKDDLEGNPRRDQIATLQKIESLCKSRGIDILYVHGPIFDHAIEQNPKFVERIDEAITSTEIPADLALQTMTFDELGSSIDHVDPTQKKEFTRRYYERLKNWMESASNPPVN